MKTIHWVKWPIGLVVLTVLAICLSPLFLRSHKPPQAGPVLAVIHEQQAVARNCTPKGQFLLFPYAKRVAQIDATACPDDFFQAWQKYVADVQTLAAIHRANADNAVVSVGVALVTKNPLQLLGAIPKNPEESEISYNTAVADWQNVKHVALRYGIKITPPQYSKRHEVQHSM
jgi:hypothetical protein